ncbi:MAG: penicillin-binding protein 2 [Acidimicrobiia bacterium]
MSNARVRTSIVGVVVFALFSALFARLWYLQVASADQFHAQANQNAIREIREPGVRGRVLDASGKVLVENRVANQITIDRKVTPAQLTHDLRTLAPLLRTTVKDLRARVNDTRISPYTAVPIATDVSYDMSAWVAEHKAELPGVRADQVPVRDYPNGTVASHVLGYVGEINAAELKRQVPKDEYQLGDQIGKSGVELTYESDLHGHPGVTHVEVDSSGKVIRTLDAEPSKPGHDLRLTLNLDVQRTAEDALAQGMAAAQKAKDVTYKKGFKTLAAGSGTVIVLDATSGSVVALASLPDFDPNQFVNGIPAATWKQLQDPASRYPLLDRAVAGQYAPGSTFKLVTAVAGLQSGFLTPYKIINDTGSYAYPSDPSFKFGSDGPAGRVDLNHALAVSSDVYFYTVGGELYYRWKHGLQGGDALQTTARSFGFGSPTGIALPNEATGRVPDPEWKKQIHEDNPQAFPYPDWLPGDSIHLAVGQEVLVTPIQLATAYAALANGGTRYSPRLADAVYDARGHKVRDLPSIELGKVDLPNRDAIMAGMTNVIEYPKGTAAEAFSGFPKGLAAGKTGTAQVAGKQNTSWFVGMTPAANPKYVVLAMVEEGGYGAQTAAPIARAVMEQLNGLPVGPVKNVAVREN